MEPYIAYDEWINRGKPLGVNSDYIRELAGRLEAKAVALSHKAGGFDGPARAFFEFIEGEGLEATKNRAFYETYCVGFAPTGDRESDDRLMADILERLEVTLAHVKNREIVWRLRPQVTVIPGRFKALSTDFAWTEEYIVDQNLTPDELDAKYPARIPAKPEGCRSEVINSTPVVSLRFRAWLGRLPKDIAFVIPEYDANEYATAFSGRKVVIEKDQG